MGFVNNSATGGAFPASLSPAQNQVTLSSNSARTYAEIMIIFPLD